MTEDKNTPTDEPSYTAILSKLFTSFSGYSTIAYMMSYDLLHYNGVLLSLSCPPFGRTEPNFFNDKKLITTKHAHVTTIRVFNFYVSGVSHTNLSDDITTLINQSQNVTILLHFVTASNIIIHYIPHFFYIH